MIILIWALFQDDDTLFESPIGVLACIFCLPEFLIEVLVILPLAFGILP